MASLRKHPKTKNWIGCYTDDAGKQRQRSTKTPDRKKALKIVNAWEDAYRDIVTEAGARKVLSGIYRDVHKHNVVSSLSQQFHDILVASGLAKERTNKSTGKGRNAKRTVAPLSFHSLRHTSTSLL